MIIHLDSTFRNVEEYPYASEFEIDFNGKPPPNRKVRDVRSQFLTIEYAQFSFRWIGDTTLPGISTLPNDALQIQYIPINASTVILYEPSEAVQRLENDYFVGLQFFDQASGLSAVVTSYKKSLLRLTLDNPIFSQSFGNITPAEMARSLGSSLNVTVGHLVNPSFTTGNNLLILGSTTLIPESPTEVALAKGLNTNLWVQNVSKGWSSKILSVFGQYRSVLLVDFPSYDSNDYFIVWRFPNKPGKSKRPLFIQGIFRFALKTSSPGFSINETLVDLTDRARFRVAGVDREGRITSLECLDPGSEMIPGATLYLRTEPPSDRSAEVFVQETANGLITETIPAHLNDSHIDQLLAILDPETFKVLYFAILAFGAPIIYVDAINEEWAILNQKLDSYLSHKFDFFLVPFFTVYPSINAPVVPYQNAVCYEARVASISLPNLPVCGFDVLLSDLPFVFVSLFNTNGPNNESYGSIISNNPNSVLANFVCPIANIRNPDTVKFVVVGSYQRQIFKFTPRNSLRFRVSLPNGSLLRYTDADVNYVAPCLRYESRESACDPLNLPLNNPTSRNSLRVFPYELSNLISATFIFEPFS